MLEHGIERLSTQIGINDPVIVKKSSLKGVIVAQNNSEFLVETHFGSIWFTREEIEYDELRRNRRP